MAAFLTLFGVVALAFASTNIDNLLLLIGWQLGSERGGRLFAGYFLGMSGVLLIALLIGLVGYLFPLSYLGYLGVIPVLLGLRLLIGSIRTGAVDEEPERAPAGGTVAIAATQLSNGVDTVLVFAPLLADSRFLFDVEIAVLFLLLVIIWFLLARVLSHRMGRLTVISRLGHWLAPLVMIGVGLYILSDTVTDVI